jgi:glycine/D-amino acid oxidase-like deaminating enzyme
MERREFLKNVSGSAVMTAVASSASLTTLSAQTVATSTAAVPAAQSASLVSALACPTPVVHTPEGTVPLPLVRATPDRIISLTVCTRPFRMMGPRIESERLGRKTLVHNYGHGGSGWSLSWGSAQLAVRQVLQTREREIAVIGAGVIGLTSALMAQRAGLKVRIYAKDRFPDVRSTFATGSWSPNSRYCAMEGATPELAQRWEEMARFSFRMFQNLLGLSDDPVEWRDGYRLIDAEYAGRSHEIPGEPEYPDLEERTSDIFPSRQPLAVGTHPFPTEIVRRYSLLVFNLSAYSRLLTSDFLAAGGAFEAREFERPGDLARLREKTIINATGYGARALFGDESIIPVRGQLMRLVPQPEVTYGLQYNDSFNMLPRRDGILLQSQYPGDFDNADATPDRAAAERTVQSVADLNARIRAKLACEPAMVGAQ